MERLIYLPGDIPGLERDWWQPFAEKIKRKMEYWRLARLPQERIWTDCDEAYLCYRRLPKLESMPYLDLSDLGETDVFDGVNNLSTKLCQAVMPKDNSWLTLMPSSSEDPAITRGAQAQQVWMHRQARTRLTETRNIRQAIVRGTSHIYLKWSREYSYRLLAPQKARNRMAMHLRRLGADPADATQIHKVREEVVDYNGPRARVVDAFDVFLDPEADMVCDRQTPHILRQFLRPSEIKKTYDEDGKLTYQNIKDLKPQKAGDIYTNAKDGARRLRSLRILGINIHNNQDVSAEVVPVYIYYAPYEEHDGIEFYDCYFHVAFNNDNVPRIIRVEENPAVNGHPLLLTETFIDWYTNAAYGITPVDKVMAAWHQKNFLAAVMLNGAAATSFPAYLVQGGVLKEDIFKAQPGAINELSQEPNSPDWLRPVPLPPNMMTNDMQIQEFYKNKIAGTFETTGAYQQEMSGSRETATSVNFRASQTGSTVDEVAEKLSANLQKWCQWAYDMSMETQQPTGNDKNGNPTISYGQVIGSQIIPGEMVFEQWKQPRQVEVLGLEGAFSKQQGVQNKTEFLKALGQVAAQLPNAPAIANDVIKALAQDLEIQIQDSSWQTNQQIAANDPQVQQQALQQGMQDPQVVQQLVQQGMQQLVEQGTQKSTQAIIEFIVKQIQDQIMQQAMMSQQPPLGMPPGQPQPGMPMPPGGPSGGSNALPG